MSEYKIDEVKYKGYQVSIYQDKFGYYECDISYNNCLCASIAGFEDIDEIEEHAYTLIDNADSEPSV